MGSAIDKENRNLAGKPAFIFIPDKWKWLFRNRVNTYAGKNKILRVIGQKKDILTQMDLLMKEQIL